MSTASTPKSERNGASIVFCCVRWDLAVPPFGKRSWVCNGPSETSPALRGKSGRSFTQGALHRRPELTCSGSAKGHFRLFMFIFSFRVNPYLDSCNSPQGSADFRAREQCYLELSRVGLKFPLLRAVLTTESSASGLLKSCKLRQEPRQGERKSVEFGERR